MDQIQSVSISKLVPSPSQPRKVFKGIRELGEDLAKRGVMVPLIVREGPKLDPIKQGPKAKLSTLLAPEVLEVVDGERRWRAALDAKLEELPVIVRVLSDAEVLEIQLVSQCQRNELHPLEEADAFKELHDKHGYTHERIAEKMTKSVATIAQRMKLCDLEEPARKAFLDGKFTLATALLIARIPAASQKEAVKIVLEKFDKNEPVGPREVRWMLEDKFMLLLEGAPFALTDKELVPEAGACNVCPKRTSNQGSLFSAEKSRDMCTDRTCFDAKVKASFEEKKADHEKRQLPIIEGKKAAGAALAHGSGFLKLDQVDYTDAKQRTLRDKIHKAKADVTITLVKDEHGAPVEVVRVADLKKAGVIAAGGDAARTRGMSAAEKKARDRAMQAAAAKRDEVVTLLAKVTQVGAAARELAFARALTKGIARMTGHDHSSKMAKRLELVAKKKKYGGPDYRGAIEKHVDTLDALALRAIAVELVCEQEPTRGEFVKLYGKKK